MTYFENLNEFSVTTTICSESDGYGHKKELVMLVKPYNKFIFFKIFLDETICSSTTDFETAIEAYNNIDMRFVHY